MSGYKFESKTLKKHYNVLSQTWLKTKAAKLHPDYPKLEWQKHPDFRLHVKLNHSIDRTYIVSVIDDEHEKATIQQIVAEQVKGIGGSGGFVSHMNPDTPFKTIQTAEFCKDLYKVVEVKGLCPGNDFVEDVMRYFRIMCRGTEIDDHLFITLEFCTHEVYICYEGVADSC